MDILKLFGLNLKTLRLEKGLSQEKLAELSELHRTYISSIELGKRNVSLKNIEAISRALDVPIEKFFVDIQTRNNHEVDEV
jgi:transcriptional regulator with XRE-family HTH domain